MNEIDQRHLDAVIALYEKKLKESVDLKALQKWCKVIPSKDLTQYEIGYKQALKDTFSWAEKQAGEK